MTHTHTHKTAKEIFAATLTQRHITKLVKNKTMADHMSIKLMKRKTETGKLRVRKKELLTWYMQLSFLRNTTVALAL